MKIRDERYNGSDQPNNDNDDRTQMSKQIAAIATKLNVDAPVSEVVTDTSPDDISKVTGTGASMFGANAHKKKKE